MRLQRIEIWLCLLIAVVFGIQEAGTQGVNCNVPGDVVVLMDASNSVQPNDWDRQKKFVEILIDSLTIQPNAIHVGMVVYSTFIGDVIGLKPYKTKSMLKAMSRNLTQLRDGTDTGRGIAEVRKMFRLQGRSNTPHVAIVMTDGMSTIPAETIRQALMAKREGTTIIAVGIGNMVFMDELQQIASSSSKLFNVQDFRALQGLVETLRDIICWEVTTTTSTTTTTTTTTPVPTTTYPPWTPILPEGLACSNPADVIFVLDGSQSILNADWIREKQFVAQLITSLEIGPTAINVGIVVYSSTVGDVLQLRPFKTKRRMIELTMSLKQPRFGTNTQLGIAMARQMISFQGRKDTPQIVIVITDGRSKRPSDTIIQAMGAKSEGINMIAVGVGTDIFMDELRAITSSQNQLFLAADFRALAGLVQILKDLICKVITTTPVPIPTTTAIPPPSTTTDGLCDGCIIDKGVGYNPYPGDCSKFVQCFLEGSSYRSVIRPCPFGLFWDQNAITCRHVSNVVCKYDRCQNMPDYSVHPYTGQGCRAFWMCKSGRSEPECCPLGSRYLDKVGCIKDAQCTEVCPPYQVNHTTTSCTLRRHPDKRFYLETIPGFGEMARPCAPGSVFSEIQCTCIAAPGLYLPVQGCSSSVHYSFDGEIKDSSNNGVTAGVDNVRISNRGTAMFNGKSKVNIWRFAGVDFGPELLIKFRYRMWTPTSDWTPGSGGTWTWDSNSNSWTNSSTSAGSWMSGSNGMWIGTNDQTGQQWIGLNGLGGHWVGSVGTGTGGSQSSHIDNNYWQGQGSSSLWPNYWTGGNTLGIGSGGIGLGNMWTGAVGMSGTSSLTGSGNWVGSTGIGSGAWTGTISSGSGGTWTGVSRTGSGSWSGTTTSGQQVIGTWTDLSGLGTYGIWNVTSGPWVGTSGTWLLTNNGGGVWTVSNVAGWSSANTGTTGQASTNWGNMGTAGQASTNWGNMGTASNTNTFNGMDSMWTDTMNTGNDGIWTGTLETDTSWSRGSDTLDRGQNTWTNVQGTSNTRVGTSSTGTEGDTVTWKPDTNGINSVLNTVNITGTRKDTVKIDAPKSSPDQQEVNNIIKNVDSSSKNKLNAMFSLDSFNFLGGKWENGRWVSDNAGPAQPRWTGNPVVPRVVPSKPIVPRQPPIRGGWAVVGGGTNNVPTLPTNFPTRPDQFNIDAQWVVQPNVNTGGTATRVEGGRWVSTPIGPSSTTTDSQGRSFITGAGVWKIVGPDGKVIRSGAGNSIPANVINELMGNTGTVRWTKQLEWTIIGPDGQLIRSGKGQIPQNLMGTATVLAGNFFDTSLGNVSQWVVISNDGRITKHGIGNSPNVAVPVGSLLMKIMWSSGAPRWIISKTGGAVIKSGSGDFPQTLDLSNLLAQVRSGSGGGGIGQGGSSVVNSGSSGRWIVGNNQGPQVVKVGTGSLPVAIGGRRWTSTGTMPGGGSSNIGSGGRGWSSTGTMPGGATLDLNKIISSIGGQLPGLNAGSSGAQQGSSGTATFVSGPGSRNTQGGGGSSNLGGGGRGWSSSGTMPGGATMDINKIISSIGGRLPGLNAGSSGAQQGSSGTVRSRFVSGTGNTQGGSGPSNIAGVSSVSNSGFVDTSSIGSRGQPNGRGSFDVKVDKTAIGPLTSELVPIKMRSKRSLTRSQAIITNCNGMNGEGPSILVSGGPDHISFSIKTTNNLQPVQLTLPAQPGYNDVKMMYNGSELTAVVNGVTKSIPLSGKIEMRQAGILLGACDGFDNFQGEIDDFELFECIPPHYG